MPSTAVATTTTATATATTAAIQTWQAFDYHWLVWQLCGIKPMRRDSKWYWPYITYAVVLNFSVTLLFPTSFIINCCLSENLNDLCENLYITITDVICNLKYLNVLLVRHKLLEVRGLLERLDVRASSDPELQVLRQGMESARRCFHTFLTMFTCAIITSQLVVYVSAERMLMYPAWYPWDWKETRGKFLSAHCYQLFGLIVQAMQDLGNDTYPQAYLTILAAQMRALAIRIERLGRSGRMSDAMTESQAYEELVNCIKDHKVVLQLFLTIQETISTACLAQFVCTGLAQCTIGVYMFYVGMDYSKLLNIVIFFGAVTMEIFILCYYGDLVCQESENLTQAIYSCNWMDQSKRFKSALQLLLQRSQKINVIMAGNLIPVRLPTFVQVIKTAYSVFTVLNNFN